MGRTALGLAWCCFAGASLGFLWPAAARAQGPGAPAGKPAAAAPAAPSDPAPLDPPPSPPPVSGPTFLHRREEPAVSPAVVEPADDLLKRGSPWIDFSLTSFYLDARVGNFLNLGVQFGAYAFERLRLSARLVTPLENVNDGYRGYSVAPGVASTTRLPSRSMSVLYGASAGVIVTNSKAFVFGPSLGFLRTDVEDYGTAVVLGLPFEWTTRRNLRIGFELALGHAVGGSFRSACTTGVPVTSCGIERRDRSGGTTVLFQYNMGWALGAL
jgi:hypothetical protein